MTSDERAKLVGKNARNASMDLLKLKESDRNFALKSLEEVIERNISEIVKSNEIDLKNGKESNLSSSLIDRLVLNEKAIRSMILGIVKIREWPSVLGEIKGSRILREDGLEIKKERVPIGVIAMIFESRPNVVIDSVALSIKSGNAIILKGGKEAYHSNKKLVELVHLAIKDFLPLESIQLIDSKNKEIIQALMQMPEYLDLLIPRGGTRLIEYVYKHAKVPIIAHYKGLCHIYVHEDANLNWAENIIVNAKVDRPGVCNAVETIILHQGIADHLLPKLVVEFAKHQVDMRGDLEAIKIGGDKISLASGEDWNTEYLDKIISIKTVKDLDEAIMHINKYGSHHTEGICAKDRNIISKFKNSIDASCIVVNASTRFNDGGELGLGAEIGISTSKLHAYGPMGAKELTTSRFIVEGKGHVRD